MADAAVKVKAPAGLVDRMDTFRKLGVAVGYGDVNAFPAPRLLFGDPLHPRVSLASGEMWNELYGTVLEYIGDFIKKSRRGELYTADEIERWERLASNLERGLEMVVRIQAEREVASHRAAARR